MSSRKRSAPLHGTTVETLPGGLNAYDPLTTIRVNAEIRPAGVLGTCSLATAYHAEQMLPPGQWHHWQVCISSPIVSPGLQRSDRFTERPSGPLSSGGHFEAVHRMPASARTPRTHDGQPPRSQR